VVVAVDENGKILGVNNPDNLPTAIFLAGYAAARQWQFRPYMHNGKPDSFDAISPSQCDECRSTDWKRFLLR